MSKRLKSRETRVDIVHPSFRMQTKQAVDGKWRYANQYISSMSPSNVKEFTDQSPFLDTAETGKPDYHPRKPYVVF